MPRSATHEEIEKLYRAVADGEPRFEILQMMHDIWGPSCNLRPPRDEIRLADRCRAGGGMAHG
ncbi:hypothetical protein [Rhizobium sp. Nf11,1]|uniref:hypothetical protein n=1 Tax=Rhizobium sp. Nf11,1 TaxID=3404923 RepID=UPI003D342103